MLWNDINVQQEKPLGSNSIIDAITELVQHGLTIDDEDALLKYASSLLVNNHSFQFSVLYRITDRQVSPREFISYGSPDHDDYLNQCEHLARQLVIDESEALVIHPVGLDTYYAIPLLHHNEIIAVLTVVGLRSKKNHVTLITSFAKLLSSLMVNLHKNQRLSQAIHSRTEELETAWELAEANSKTKSQFLTNLSHELLTPLSVIMGAGTLLADTKMDIEQVDYLNSLTLSSEKLKSMVHGMLDYTLSESGQLAFESDVIDVKKLMSKIFKTFYPVAAGKNLQLTLRIDAGTPDKVLVDPYRLHQILSHLISNAIKFTHEGRITISLSSESISRVETSLKFSVKDTGIGIAANKLKQIFEAFNQLDNSTTRQYEGAGLGLAICQKIVVLMGAGISVTSQPGQGSEFSFELQVPTETLDLADSASTLPRESNDSSTTLLHCYKVLLVEDNLINQKVARKLLENMGCVVEVANDGLDAIRMFSRTPYDVIFMDCQMPNMDGFDATIKIREMESGSRTPIIALTANTLPEDRARSYQVGMDEFLTKPIIKETLQSALTKWVVH